VAVDGAGNLYIADTGNHRVRRLGKGGEITSVAGTGTAGFSGDGRHPTEAQFAEPFGVAVDGAGTGHVADTLYVADTGNHRVRRVDTNDQ
jgi:sugar lactone lactonase YvrE